MPNPRRTARFQHQTFPGKPKIEKTGDNSGTSEHDSNSLLASIIVAPRHAHFPEIGLDSNILFEGFVFIFGTMGLVLQYINLYKTVWWLPQSHSNYALNFYLIDPYLSVLLVLIMSRRVVYVFLKEFGIVRGTKKNNVEELRSKSSLLINVKNIAKKYSRSCGKRTKFYLFYTNRGVWTCCLYMVKVVKFLVGVALVQIFGYCVYQVIGKYSLMYSLFLCYPLATYIVLFGSKIEPLFGKKLGPNNISAFYDSSREKSGNVQGTPKHRTTAAALRAQSPTMGLQAGMQSPGGILSSEFGGYPFIGAEVPIHVCSMTPEVIRDEVEALKTDFNSRIKQVLFNSLTCAYYMGFVPLCFAQNTLYYDTFWVGQHVCLIWISAFVMFTVHFFPARYLDTLHQAALHLGKWGKVEGRHAHVPYNAWSELQVWQKGALVKHVKGLFKAEGINNSAEPGNGMHSRFNFMFHTPCRLTNWLLTITWCLVLYQFWLLIQSNDWSHVTALAFLLFCNYYILFKLLRDRLVMGKAYKGEHT